MAVVMQARDSSSGEMVTWSASSPDWNAASYPGPGDAEDIAVAATDDASGGGGGSPGGTSGQIQRNDGAGGFAGIAFGHIGNVLRQTSATAAAFGPVDLTDADAVVGALPRANGGTGLDLGTLTGQAGKVLAVTDEEDGLELVEQTGGGGDGVFDSLDVEGNADVGADLFVSANTAFGSVLDDNTHAFKGNVSIAPGDSFGGDLAISGDVDAGGSAVFGNPSSTDESHTFYGPVTIEAGPFTGGDLDVTGDIDVAGEAWIGDHLEFGFSAVASDGLIRGPNNSVLLAARNAAGTADIAAVSVTSGNAVWIGNQASGIGSQATQAFLNGSSQSGLAAGGSSRVTVSATSFGISVPMFGAGTGINGGVDGIGVQAMADANQTVLATVYKYGAIECTGTLTATRQITLVTPANVENVYRRLILNRCSGGSIEVKTAAGTATVTIAAGMAAWVEVRNGTTGVARGSADVAHGLA